VLRHYVLKQDEEFIHNAQCNLIGGPVTLEPPVLPYKFSSANAAN